MTCAAPRRCARSRCRALEREIQIRLASGQPLDEEMLVLGRLEAHRSTSGLPETGDLVIAGPASDWKLDRRVASGKRRRWTTGRATRPYAGAVATPAKAGGDFACSIVPTDEGLAKAQDFVNAASGKPLQPGQRGKWLDECATNLAGKHVVFEGIDPQSNVAQALLAADHHMKLIGIGLEPGT